jgi:6-phosphogluconolactonase (cycloisomerase 2 family)
MIAGSWFYRPGPKGISLLDYDVKDGSLRLLETKFRSVNADAMSVDREKKIAYFADACATPRGGHVAAVKVDTETGKMELIDQQDTLFRDPNYIWLDRKTSKYAFVTHHSNQVLVNHLIRGKNGFDVKALYDDVGLVVFRMNEDGTFDSICDVVLTSVADDGKGEHAYSRQHSVVEDPGGKMLIVCDKGLDRIYSLTFDREQEKLRLIQQFQLSEETGPRYGIFHPDLPFYYCSCEKKLSVLVFQYDAETGLIQFRAEVPLTDVKIQYRKNPKEKIESGDIKINEKKDCIYVTIRGLNQIAVLRIGTNGMPVLEQTISCGGDNPRCLCISPDGRFLLCGNLESQTIRTLKIRTDGTLELTDKETEVPMPSCMELL